MKTIWITMFILGFSLVASIPATSQNPDKRRTADVAAIQQVRADLDASWNLHDAVALGKLFLSDADFQWHTGDVLKGQKQIEQYFSESFKQMPNEYKHSTTFNNIRFLRSDIAVGDGAIVVSREGAPENEKPYMSVLFTCIGQKKNGHWYLAAVRLMLPATK